MILLDSVYINDGGGLVLLKYLVEKIKETDLDVYYLFDKRTESIFESDKSLKNILFINNNIQQRKQFYTEHADKFSSVLCFGNVPPPIRLKAKVHVYFHQPLFLNIPKSFSFKNKIIYFIKQQVLKFYKPNADKWLVQSELIRDQLKDKYFSGDGSRVEIQPFYPPLNFSGYPVDRVASSFLYVSNSAPHKNHEKLIMAFCSAYDETRKGSLVITVPSNNIQLYNFIEEKIKLGYPIQNVGFVPREELIQLYLSHQYLIFPSLAESFGLGLAEGIDGGCDIIASDLPYTYQVCKPSLTFNPHQTEDIKNAIIRAVSEVLPSSKKIISNDINQLILLLSE